jgi:hypothetical protein
VPSQARRAAVNGSGRDPGNSNGCALKRGPSKEKESDEQNPEMRGTTYVTPLFPRAATSHDENC